MCHPPQTVQQERRSCGVKGDIHWAGATEGLGKESLIRKEEREAEMIRGRMSRSSKELAIRAEKWRPKSTGGCRWGQGEIFLLRIINDSRLKEAESAKKGGAEPWCPGKREGWESEAQDEDGWPQMGAWGFMANNRTKSRGDRQGGTGGQVTPSDGWAFPYEEEAGSLVESEAGEKGWRCEARGRRVERHRSSFLTISSSYNSSEGSRMPKTLINQS